MVTGGLGEESSVLLLSGDMWIKRNPLPQRVAPNHSLAQVQNSIYLIDTKVSPQFIFRQLIFYQEKYFRQHKLRPN